LSKTYTLILYPKYYIPKRDESFYREKTSVIAGVQPVVISLFLTQQRDRRAPVGRSRWRKKSLHCGKPHSVIARSEATRQSIISSANDEIASFHSQWPIEAERRDCFVSLAMTHWGWTTRLLRFTRNDPSKLNDEIASLCSQWRKQESVIARSEVTWQSIRWFPIHRWLSERIKRISPMSYIIVPRDYKQGAPLAKGGNTCNSPLTKGD